MYSHFIGIDISKDTLDITVVSPANALLHEQRIANEKTVIVAFFKQLARRVPGFSPATALCCLEHTGRYSRPLLEAVQVLALPTGVEHAPQLTASTGLSRGKTDQADARRIAAYAARFVDRARLWTAPRPVPAEPGRLSARRARLVKAGKMLQPPLTSSETFFSAAEQRAEERGCAASLKALAADLAADLAAVDKAIQALVAGDETLARQYGRITSVPGVGPGSAVGVLLTTNEFCNSTDPRQYACYAGVVPFERSSGQRKGRPGVSHRANKRVKTLLHLAAPAAVRYCQQTKACYARKVAEGKNKILVLNNVRNKLVHRIFACVQQDRDYDKSYAPALV